MHLTPSAISHQIRELEEQLGLQLFARRTRALELTTAGQTLLDEVEPLLLAIEDVLARLAPARDREAVHVALPPFFASELFIPRLAQFYVAQPDIDIQVTTQDPRPIDHPASADVSVLLLEAAPAELVAEELVPLQLVAACAPSIANRARTLGSSVFKEAALIVQRARRDAWERWARDSGLTPPERRKVIELDTMYAVVRAAEQGLGIALVPEIAARSWFTSGSLVRFSARELETGERYYLVHRREDASQPEIVAFHYWAISEFRAP
jgi:LysR family glycine cleavage system transcriptional activator